MYPTHNVAWVTGVGHQHLCTLGFPHHECSYPLSPKVAFWMERLEASERLKQICIYLRFLQNLSHKVRSWFLRGHYAGDPSQQVLLHHFPPLGFSKTPGATQEKGPPGHDHSLYSSVILSSADISHPHPGNHVGPDICRGCLCHAWLLLMSGCESREAVNRKSKSLFQELIS